MKSQLILDMSEECLERVRRPRQSWVVNVLEQVQDCSSEVYICLPEVIADEICLAGAGDYPFFAGKLRIVFDLSVIHVQPPQLVVRASYIVESHYKISEHPGFRGSGMKSDAVQAFSLDMDHTTLSRDIRIDILHCPDYIVSSVCSDADDFISH